MELPAIVTQKFGPLPGWAWGGLAIGAAVLWSALRGKGDAPTDEPADPSGYPIPETLHPTYVFQNYDQDVTYGSQTTVNVPPGGGRPTPTPAPPRPTPTPTPGTPTPPPAPKGSWVTVTPWKAGQPAGTPSTLWGIAEKVYGRGKGGLWNQIWSAPQNAALRGKRKDPAKIQSGDRFWVPQ